MHGDWHALPSHPEQHSQTPPPFREQVVLTSGTEPWRAEYSTLAHQKPAIFVVTLEIASLPNVLSPLRHRISTSTCAKIPIKSIETDTVAKPVLNFGMSQYIVDKKNFLRSAPLAARAPAMSAISASLLSTPASA